MIWRIRDRSTFVELHRWGVRRHRGPVGVVWLDQATASPPRVGFSIGRRTGTAVVRNRLRRQLRAIMHQAADEGLVTKGAYLVTVRGGVVPLSADELGRHLMSALRALPSSRGCS